MTIVDRTERVIRRWRYVSWNLVNCCTTVREKSTWKGFQTVNDLEYHSRSL